MSLSDTEPLPGTIQSSIASNILRVAVPTPLRKLFDYLPPENYSLELLPGQRVQIPFGATEQIGVIVEVTQESDHPFEKLKRVNVVLDIIPLFSKTLLELIHWASSYYQSSLGEVFDAAIPGWLRKGKNPEVLLKTSETAFLQKKKALVQEAQAQREKALVLNPEQHYAVHSVTQTIGGFQTFLLDGVTGSGKTEVYCQIIEQALQKSQQVLILVPEIGLTPQIVARLKARFNCPIAVLHSLLTEKQRFKAWLQAKEGLAPIVVGTRSAVFTPLKNPGVFIVDEEHDTSFKQQDGFRYSARDLIIRRGQLEQCPVVLGTATPSLETLLNVQLKRYQHLKLPVRAGNAELPTIQILDIRHKKLDEGLSAQLIHNIQEHLKDGNQVLLFLNRRGFSPVFMCFDCGWVKQCLRCDAKMTLHYRPKRLQCHHCEATCFIPKHCPACDAKNLNPLGVGTERLEAALQKHFANYKIVRLDRDTTRKKGALKEALETVQLGKADILLGTQMIAKGHHFPNVTLVAILDIDSALFSVDFRSMERMGQLITQVAGRAGRAEKSGHVILQTCHPEHYLIKTLLKKGFDSFAAEILNERKSASLPPYSYHILIRADAKKSDRALNFLNEVKKEANKLNKSNIQILGPTPAPMERRIGYYRAQLLFQSHQRGRLQRFMQQLVSEIGSHSLSRTVRWSMDVDPMDMY